MGYYYVKKGGTAVGDAGLETTTPRTGTFTAMGVSAYYDSIKDVAGGGGVPTTAIAAGDTICVSSVHSFDTIANTTYTFPDGCMALCVDDANAENLSTGASEGSSATGSDTIILMGATGGGRWATYGIDWRSDFNFNIANANDDCGLIENATFIQTSTGKAAILLNQTGSCIICRDTSIKVAGTTEGIEVGKGARLEMRGGGIDATGSAPTSLIRAITNAGQFFLRCFDASKATGLYTAAANVDSPLIKLSRLKVASGATLSETGTTQQGPVFDMDGYGTAGGNEDDYWGFHGRYYNFGSFDHDTSIYRDPGANVDAVQKLTVLMSATDQVMPYFAPLRFKLAEIKLDLTSAVTLTVELAQWDDGNGAPTRLKDDEFWLEIERPDSTDLALGVIDTTRPTTYDISATQADLTTSTKVWKKGSDDSTIAADITKSSVAHTLSAITGASNAHVTVWACLAKDLSAVGDVNVDLLVDES